MDNKNEKDLLRLLARSDLTFLLSDITSARAQALNAKKKLR